MRAGVMLVLGWLLVSPAQAIEMQLHGTLVAEPCSLEPDQQQLELNFGDIVAKSLYQNPRTPARPLVMRLAVVIPNWVKTSSWCSTALPMPSSPICWRWPVMPVPKAWPLA